MSATSSSPDPAQSPCQARRPLAPSACFPSVWPPRPTDSAIRPFHINVPEAATRRPSPARAWRRGGPTRETVTDQSQGVQLATIQKLARYWDDGLRLAQVRGEAQCPAAFHHRDRRARHSFHSRSLETRKCAAADRHAWVARLDHRAAEDHRSADQSHGAWRERIGRLPSGDSVAAGLRVFRQADHDGLGPRPHRARLGRTLMKRLGYTRYVAQGGDWGDACRRADGAAGAAGIARHSHQHARPRFRPMFPRRFNSAGRRRPASRRTNSTRRTSSTFSTSTGWATPGDGEPPADALRNRGFAGRPRGVDPRSRRPQLRADRPRLRRTARRPHARRHPRQHHALLADEHGDLFGASLLGNTQLAARASSTSRDVTHPGRRERLSGRDLYRPAELGGEGVSQAHPLQQASTKAATSRPGNSRNAFRQRAARGVPSLRTNRPAAQNRDPAVAGSRSPSLRRNGPVVRSDRIGSGNANNQPWRCVKEISMERQSIITDRRRFFGAAAMTIAAAQLGMIGSAAGAIRQGKAGRTARDQAGNEHVVRSAEADRCRPPECRIRRSRPRRRSCGHSSARLALRHLQLCRCRPVAGVARATG